MKKFIVFILCSLFFSSLCVKAQDSEELLRQAKEAFASRNFSKAIEFAQQAYKKDPKNADILQFLANVYLFTKDFQQSEEYLNTLLQLTPEDFGIYYFLAITQIQQAKYDEAINNFKQRLDKFPSDVVTLTYLAYTLFQAGQSSRALEVMEKVITLNLQGREDLSLFSKLEGISYELPFIIPDRSKLKEAVDSLNTPQALLLKGWYLFEETNLESAKEVFLELTNKNPNYALAHFLYGLSLYKTEEVDKAIKEWQLAEKLSPAFIKFIKKDYHYIEEAKKEAQLIELEKKAFLDASLENLLKLAKAYIENNELSRAEEQLKLALSKSTQSEEALFLSGKLASTQYKYEKAISFLEKVITRNPNHKEALALLTLCYQKTDKFTKAINSGEKALKLNPSDISLSENLAYAYFFNQDYARALQLFKKCVLTASPTTKPKLLCYIGFCYHNLGKLKDAAIEYQKAIGLNPKLVDAYFNLAIIYYLQGYYSSSLQCYQKVLELRSNYESIFLPDFQEALIGVGRCKLALGEKQQSAEYFKLAVEEAPYNPRAYYFLAEAKQEEGKKEEARKNYTKSAELLESTFYPEMVDTEPQEDFHFLSEQPPLFVLSSLRRWALNELGEMTYAYPQTRSLSQIITSLKKRENKKAFNILTNLNKNSSLYHHIAGIIYAQEKFYHLAMQELLLARSSEKENSWQLENNLGVVSFYLGKKDLAEKFLKNSIELKFNNFPAYNNIGIIQYKSENYDDAEESFYSAKTSDPSNPWGAHNYAWLLSEIGKDKEAFKAINQAIKLNPKEALFWGHYGWLLQEDGKIAKAIFAYKKAIELDPATAYYYNNLALALVDEGNLEEAKQLLLQAIKIEPDEPLYYSNLAILCYKEGNFKEAKDYAVKSLEKDFYNTMVQSDLGCIYYKLQSSTDSINQFKSALFYNTFDFNPITYLLCKNNLGSIYLDQNKINLTIDLLEKTISSPTEYNVDNILVKSVRGNIYLTLALAQLLNNQREEALLKLEKAKEMHPDNLNMLSVKALFASLEENSKEAQNLYLKAIKLSPQPYLYNNLATLFCSNKEFKEAADFYKKAIELDSQYWLAHYNLGGIYYTEKSWAEAEKEWLKIPPASPLYSLANYWLEKVYAKGGKENLSQEAKQKEVNYNRKVTSLISFGWTYREFKQNDLAEDCFERALEIAPAHKEALIGLASVLYNEQKFDECEKVLDKALSIYQNLPLAYIIKALCAYQYGKPDDVDKYLNEALRFDPKQEIAIYNLGYFYQEKGKWEEVKEVFHKLEKLYPKALTTLTIKGFLAFHQGKTEEAKALAFQVLQNDTGFSDAWYLLGRIAEVEGDFHKAYNYYERAFMEDPLHKEAKEKLLQLKPEKIE